MRILLLASHGIAEYDDIRMFSDLGYDVFCPGGYADPSHPGETLRPALPDAPHHPELAALCEIQREKHAGEPTDYVIDWAKADLHPDLIDWADVIICHHFPVPWIFGQWSRLRSKRVIWRTCGQSNPDLERFMAPLHRQGLQIVRYSPRERTHFERIGAFAGEDALIRFGKYPSDYGPWIGDNPVIGNVTQWGRNLERGDAVGLSFWQAATEGLPARPAGPGSEALPGGLGALSYDALREYLRHIRAYVYMGTAPASYTLGLIEAMLSGVPVVSISASSWQGPADLFEGDEIAQMYADTPAYAAAVIQGWFNYADESQRRIHQIRQRAIDLFDVAKIGPLWTDFLGAPVALERETVTA